MKKVLLLVSLVLAVSVMFTACVIETKSESKAALIDRQLSFCQELVTSKYRYSDIISLKNISLCVYMELIISSISLLDSALKSFFSIINFPL